VKEHRKDPVHSNWGEEGEVEVGNVGDERLDWRQGRGGKSDMVEAFEEREMLAMVDSITTRAVIVLRTKE